MDEEEININGQNMEKNELSCCVVWTQIPLLSWLLPFFGHVGICDSQGVVYDFEGPKYVGKGRLLFGDPMEKWKLKIDSETLDRSIAEATEEFQHRNFSILCSNCHFYVATVLKNAFYEENLCCCKVFSNWTCCATLKIALSMIFFGRSIKWNSKLCMWAGFLILWGIIVFLILFSKGLL